MSILEIFQRLVMSTMVGLIVFIIFFGFILFLVRVLSVITDFIAEKRQRRRERKDKKPLIKLPKIKIKVNSEKLFFILSLICALINFFAIGYGLLEHFGVF